jgi:dodecin
VFYYIKSITTNVVVGDMTAKVDPNSGNITEYHTAVKIAFGVEH